jgi:hypothetical protein
LEFTQVGVEQSLFAALKPAQAQRSSEHRAANVPIGTYIKRPKV